MGKPKASRSRSWSQNRIYSVERIGVAKTLSEEKLKARLKNQRASKQRATKAKMTPPGSPVPLANPQVDPKTVAQLKSQIDREIEQEGKEKDKKGSTLDNVFNESFGRLSNDGGQPAADSIKRLTGVINSIQTQQPLADMQEELAPLLGELQAKVNVVEGVVAVHQLDRAPLWLALRHHLETQLLEDLVQRRLSPEDKIAVLKMAMVESDKIVDYLNKFANPLSNVSEIIERADRNLHGDEMKRLQAEVAGTTQQGREGIRRLTNKARNVAKALGQLSGKDK